MDIKTRHYEALKHGFKCLQDIIFYVYGAKYNWNKMFRTLI